MSRPSILLIPGSFALPEFYDAVVDPVKAKGYDFRSLHLPTVGLGPGKPREGIPPNMYNDAAFIAKEVETLADEGKDVILIAHSYGGIPITQCVKGLAKGERVGMRETQFTSRNIISRSNDAAFIAKEVETLADEGKDGWRKGREAEEGEAWIRKMSCHSAISFTNELTYAGYKDVPVSYLVCEEDLVIPLKNQREEIEMIERESGRKVDVTSIKTGHVPIASQPQLVIDWILDVVGKA
ncbi:uncharacterized protein PAC_04984 [Phialocephala subalpina]|uniref:AB hydrolase-1 domain-containing protein n=1 Tax=Phialocephala subalpina TaxID=576137 RepID=A0A1L7WQQ0_9HELO|nr:uncharacterized protein PAC_04984 [Phialocephala subalpina]